MTGAKGKGMDWLDFSQDPAKKVMNKYMKQTTAGSLVVTAAVPRNDGGEKFSAHVN